MSDILDERKKILAEALHDPKTGDMERRIGCLEQALGTTNMVTLQSDIKGLKARLDALEALAEAMVDQADERPSLADSIFMQALNLLTGVGKPEPEPEPEPEPQPCGSPLGLMTRTELTPVKQPTRGSWMFQHTFWQRSEIVGFVFPEITPPHGAVLESFVVGTRDPLKAPQPLSVLASPTTGEISIMANAGDTMKIVVHLPQPEEPWHAECDTCPFALAVCVVLH